MKNKAFPLFLIVFIVLIATVLSLEKEPKNPQLDFINHVSNTIDLVPTSPKPLKSVILAQAILESQWGQSKLSHDAQNYFGIKGSYQGDSVEVVTKEVFNDEWISISDSFRKYPSLYESIEDYVSLMNTERYYNVLEHDTYQEQAIAIMNSGYATDPDYALKIIDIIEVHRLYDYD